MAKEKGAAPLRRLPSRSGRASFEGDPTGDGDAGWGAAAAAAAATAAAADGGGEEGRGYGGGSASGARAGADSARGAVPGAAVPTPRGRGRPRKKPLEQPPPVKTAEEAGANAAVAAASAASPRPRDSSPRSVGGWQQTGGRHVSVAKREKKDDGGGGGRGEAGKAKEAKAEEEEEGVEEEGPPATGSSGGRDGNESDEWSDHDEVHYLPAETKAQFGQVVWAKFGSPPWPALVWDPRYLGKDKRARGVARKAYAALGKSHLVRFYDAVNSFACVPFKSIKPFDAAELPNHLKLCNGAKKKETYKESVQAANEASLLSRRSCERLLAEMHEVGRWTDKKPKKKAVKRIKTPLKSGHPSPSPAATATPAPATTTGAASAASALKKRGRGRPRKTPAAPTAQPRVKELDGDPPSPVSSPGGPEYELPVPEAAAEGEEEEGGEGDA
ncbi:unnamed protein product, partial [Hapterophycus canaliculatus]